MDDASDEEEFIEPVYLDLEGRELYLVKLPKELGYSWNTISDSEVVLGTLKMNKRDASGNRKGLLSVNPATLSEEIPLDYRTVLAPSALPLKVFSQDGSGRMAIEGKVTESCTLMPQPGALYKKQLGERYIKSMQKGTVVPLESTPKQVKGGITLKIPKPRESDDEEEDDGKFISKDLQNKKIKMDRCAQERYFQAIRKARLLAAQGTQPSLPSARGLSQGNPQGNLRLPQAWAKQELLRTPVASQERTEWIAHHVSTIYQQMQRWV
ncbi:hypothetical protein Ae201684P_000890 [Aphanomyces euteiches]|nr:hypothetical protein Ae201684P_000890 [Aphanomyces euteiches]